MYLGAHLKRVVSRVQPEPVAAPRLIHKIKLFARVTLEFIDKFPERHAAKRIKDSDKTNDDPNDAKIGFEQPLRFGPLHLHCKSQARPGCSNMDLRHGCSREWRCLERGKQRFGGLTKVF